MPSANVRAGRNEPCPCGSGKKYKKCHGPKEHALGTWQKVGLGLLLCAVIGGLMLAYNAGEHEASAQTGVWSPEHGHYH